MQHDVIAKLRRLIWVYICISERSRRLPMIMTSSITLACCGVTAGVCGKIYLKRCWHFCTFLHNPHFDFELDYVVRKPRKWRFQWCIVRMEIFLAFHARVEYISVKTVIGQIDLPTRCSNDAAVYLDCAQDRIKHHSISPVHSVHLVDIKMGRVPPKLRPGYKTYTTYIHNNFPCLRWRISEIRPVNMKNQRQT